MCSGLFPDSRNASSTLSRLLIFLRFASLVASRISWRSDLHSDSTSSNESISRIASAPMPTVKLSRPYFSRACASCSSLSSSPKRRSVSTGSTTMCDSK